jgi:plastocyanin
MRTSPVFLAAATGFVAMALLTFGVVAGYGMMSGGRGMSQMHERMMGGGVDTSGDEATQGALQTSVQIRDYEYTPGNLQVPVGATVTWTNYDSAPHTATAPDGSWDTGILDKDESTSLTFDSAGDYTYYCLLHSDMKARVRVG